MSTIKITTDSGEVLEYPIDSVELPEGYLTAEQVSEKYVTKDFMGKEIQRRVTSAKDNARRDLESDEEFFKQIATAKGVKFDESGKPILGSEVNIDELRSNWVESELAPLKTKLNNLQNNQLNAEIYEAAVKAGIKEDYLSAVPGSDTSMIVKLTKDSFGIDEHGRWSLKNGDGFTFAKEPTDARPYAGASEMFEELKKQNPSWFKNHTQSGSGASGGSGSAPTGDLVRAKMSVKEKTEYIDKHGREAYEKLPLK